MFLCKICKKEYTQKSGLYRHQRKDDVCKKMLLLKNNNKLLKNALQKYMKEKEELSSLYKLIKNKDDTNQSIVADNLNLKKANQQLIDDRNLLYHQLEIAKEKLHTSHEKDKVIVELMKYNSSLNNKTVINNNVIIN